MSRVAIVLLIAACSQAPLTAQIASEGTEPKAASFERDIKLLQKWPEREGRAASRRLALAGAQGADRLLPLLEHRDWRFRAGAAHTLGLIGEHRAFDLLRKGVSDVGNRIALGTYFEAMIRLDPAAGSAEVLPYLRSASPRTSKAAFEALPRKLPASLRQEVEKLWGDSSQILRLRGLKLALRFDPPPAKTVYFRFLGDRNPGICRLVAQELSESDDSELVDDLNRLVREGGLRQASYSVIALVLMEDRTSAALLDPSAATLARLRRFLRIRGGLERAAGAIGLANLSMKSDDPELRKLADEQLMFHLIDSMAGGVLFKDYGTIRDVCLAKASMLSGLAFGDQADKWRRWWVENGKSFTARRDLSSVGAIDPQYLRVEVEWTSEERRSRQTFSGSDGRDVIPRMPRSLFLSRDEMNELIKRLDAALFSDELRVAPEGESRVTIRLRASRAERLERIGDKRSAAVDNLLESFDELESSLVWQRFWSPKDDGPFRQYLSAWRALPATERLPAAVATRALKCFRGLNSIGRGYAFGVFESQDSDWVQAHRGPLLDRLKGSDHSRVDLRRWTDLLMRGASENDIRDMLDVVAGQGATCTDVVRTLLLQLPESARSGLHSDRRSVVRAAMVPIQLSAIGEANDYSQLMEMLRDPSSLVQESLAIAARSRAAFRVSLMDEVSGGGFNRGPALTVLGATGSSDVVPFLSKLLHGSELPVGLAAVSALASAGTPDALDALFGCVRAWDDDVLAASALGALGEDSRPQVKERMRALLSESQAKEVILRLLQVASGMLSETIEADFEPFCSHADPLVRRRSAELIVDNLGASGIPILIQLLDDAALLESLRTRLELISCHVKPAAGHSETQRSYSEWWDAHKGERPSQWFLSALQRIGPVRGDVNGLLVSGRKDPTAMKFLVDVIESSDGWQLRVRAHLALNRLRDVPIRPMLRRHSSEGDIALAVKRWRQWLSRIRAGIEDGQ